MSEGRVIHTPEEKHSCEPEWSFEPRSGGLSGSTPHRRKEPKGTVWECECGKTFVSLGSGPWKFAHPMGKGRYRTGATYECRWRFEGRIERWKRERKAK